MSNRRVVITGMGTVNPLAHDVESYWQALLAGRSGIARITRFDPTNFTSQIGGGGTHRGGGPPGGAPRARGRTGEARAAPPLPGR